MTMMTINIIMPFFLDETSLLTAPGSLYFFPC